MYRALGFLLLAASTMAFRIARFNPESFILNGQDADEGEWPHQCSFQTSFGFHSCGAVYLADNWIATAAHCTTGSNPGSYRIVCGVTQLSDSSSDTQFSISAFYEHPNYNPRFLENDYALIQLDNVPVGDNIEVIFADDSADQDNWENAECWITGWGQTDNGGSPNNLQEAQVLALSQQDCEDFYSGTGYGITDDMICVGHDQDDYTGACYGDSGGPLVCRKSSEDPWTFVGVTSWAYPPCGNDVYPSVYSRTAFSRDWVSETCGGCI